MRSVRHASGFAQALVEVLAGKRPIEHVDPVLAQHLRVSLRFGRRPGAEPDGRVVRVRVVPVGPQTTESVAVIDYGEHVRALAFRATVVDGRWRVTSMALLGEDAWGPTVTSETA